jgi:hypothetical protein
VQTALLRQLHRVRIPGARYHEYLSVTNECGVGLQDHGILENGPQPVRSDDGRLWLMLDGEIYNGTELAKRFRAQLPAHEMTAPELCLRLISL